MSKFKNLLMAALFASSAGAAGAQSMTLKLATEGVYPPFNYIVDNKLTGFDIDVGDELCKRIDAKCEWVTQEWTGMIPGLLAKKYDAIVASMSITEERRKMVAFTDKYQTPIVQFITSKSEGEDVSPDALKGKILGTQGSTTLANYLEAKYKGSEIKLYSSADDAFADLAAGRIDYAFSDLISDMTWLKSSAGSCCKLAGSTITDEQYLGSGKAVVLRKEDEELRTKLNAALASMISDGTFKKINDKYFEVSVY